MKRLVCPPLPDEIAKAAAEAEARKQAAIDRLSEKVPEELKPIGEPKDNFERAMRELIDADKRALQEKGR